MCACVNSTPEHNIATTFKDVINPLILVFHLPFSPPWLLFEWELKTAPCVCVCVCVCVSAHHVIFTNTLQHYLHLVRHLLANMHFANMQTYLSLVFWHVYMATLPVITDTYLPKQYIHYAYSFTTSLYTAFCCHLSNSNQSTTPQLIRGPDSKTSL